VGLNIILKGYQLSKFVSDKVREKPAISCFVNSSYALLSFGGNGVNEFK